jgi:hypothetical protein
MRNEINPIALDRWITGNYGEDQFKGECAKCGDYRHLDENDLCEKCREKEDL